ncbi:MAG TPA: OmpA family protein [Cyclobacteriaceae bacterium]|nr:OmpA family protein [Cyclobacteriaceae bacterium]
MFRKLVFIWIVVSALVADAQQQQEEIRMSIYFGGGSYDIDSFQADELFHWIDSIQNLNLLDKYEIQLISHTDPIGGKEYNEWLSQMRSESVKQLLIQQEVPENKISVKDWGLDNAVYSNRSRQGLRMNRRVDVILYPLVF